MSTDTGIIRTAFDRVQREQGCEFMDWEGWYWPSTFGDAEAEHRAVREDVGVWDESPLRKWDFRGADALAAADRIFTNDMAGLEVGQIRYAPFCDADGKMVGDGTVFKFADDHAWVITALDSDLDHFREVVGGLDVEMTPITEELPHVQLQGPRSREVLSGLTDSDVGGARLLPVPARGGRGGRSPGLGLPHGLLRRARVRDLLPAGPRRGSLGRPDRCRRAPVRTRGGRDAPDRVGARLHRLRLLPARDRSVRHVARQGDRARRRRTSTGRPRSRRRPRARRGASSRSSSRATRCRSTAPP